METGLLKDLEDLISICLDGKALQELGGERVEYIYDILFANMLNGNL